MQITYRYWVSLSVCITLSVCICIYLSLSVPACIIMADKVIDHAHKDRYIHVSTSCMSDTYIQRLTDEEMQFRYRKICICRFTDAPLPTTLLAWDILTWNSLQALHRHWGDNLMIHWCAYNARAADPGFALGKWVSILFHWQQEPNNLMMPPRLSNGGFWSRSEEVRIKIQRANPTSSV